MEYSIKIKGLNKSFGNVCAIKNVDMEVYKGESIAIAGENGAGKSTLVKILTGVYSVDSGQIFINGKEVNIKNTVEAMRLGISQVYQRCEIVPELSIAENMFLGEKDFTNRGIVDWKDWYDKADAILKKNNITYFDSSMPMKELSVADRHLISIIKILQRDANIVIFDEPTAVLSGEEVKILFNIINMLKKEKKTIIYISHRLEEIFEIVDRVFVMRDGEMVTHLKNDNIKSEDVIMYMLGRGLKKMFPDKVVSERKDEPALELKNITTPDVKNISLKLYKGEILGLSGLVGSGRTELAKAIFGLEKKMSGSILVDGKEVSISCPKDAINAGFFLAPEDRKGEGLVLTRSIKENITMPAMDEVSKCGVFKKKKENTIAQNLKDELAIKAPGIYTITGNLSGGNQQKVVLAKALMVNPKVMILDESTQGIDVGAKHELYMLINRLSKEQGMAVLFISSEMEEIIGLCSRVVVMKNGEVSGELKGEDVNDKEKILGLMYKGKKNE